MRAQDEIRQLFCMELRSTFLMFSQIGQNTSYWHILTSSNFLKGGVVFPKKESSCGKPPFWNLLMMLDLVNGFWLLATVFWHLFYVSVLLRGNQKDAQRETLQSGCEMSSRSPLAARLVIKNAIAYCLRPMAYCPLRPGTLFLLVVVFMYFRRIPGPAGQKGRQPAGNWWQLYAVPYVGAVPDM